MGVVQAGEGCDDAKVLTPAMDAATKQCPDKAIRHPSILGVNGYEWNKPEEASVSARRKGKTWKQKRDKSFGSWNFRDVLLRILRMSLP